MFNGRHCVPKDLSFLDHETEKVLSLLKSGNEVDLSHFLNVVSMFDSLISSELFNLAKGKSNKEISVIITNKIKDLRRNVIVDIQEHN